MNEPRDARPIDVAVGVLFDRAGRVLLAQRPAGKPMAGYWEFPGGKLEAGESVFDALAREFDEELGLSITASSPWARRVVAYPHATVRLHFSRSFASRGDWSGEPDAREGQAFCWEVPDAPRTEPWLPGALPVRRWLRLPDFYAISQAGALGVDAWLARFDAAIDAAIDARSVLQLQLREPTLDAARFDALFDAVATRCRRAGVRLVVNSAHPSHYWRRADGVHLRASDLRAAPTRPDVDWCFASIHDATECAHANRLDVDAVVLGPVRTTASHPGAAPLGWSAFASIASGAAMPVYALGGLARDDGPVGLLHGAHGIAAVGASWR